MPGSFNKLLDSATRLARHTAARIATATSDPANASAKSYPVPAITRGVRTHKVRKAYDTP